MGNRYLRSSWVPFYLLLPLVGASAALVFYIVLRGGLFSPDAGTGEANPFGFAAVAGLVGLFSEEAMKKLRDVFSSLFSPAPQGADTAPESRPAGAPPTVTTQAATDVKQTAARVHARVVANGLPTELRFEYGTTTDYGEVIKAATVPANGEADAEKDLTGLTPGTLYHYRARASNEAGDGVGEEMTFTTSP